MKLYLMTIILGAVFILPGLAHKMQADLPKTDIPPEIDGILNDEAWGNAAVYTDFISYSPDFNQLMPEKTTAYISYDSENLYFAFKCFDSEPEKIVGTIRNRDEIKSEDWVCLNLDTQNDQQSLIALYINPYGIQLDASYAAGKEDLSTDLVWYSAAKINEEGYVVEIMIPFKSLRFSDKEPVTMGVVLERRICRYSTQGTYPPLNPDQGMDFLNQMMEISMTGVGHYRLFEAIPAFTYSYRDSRTGGEWGKGKHRPAPSLTLKYGITSNLVFDATLNPDYSQVESDAGQIDVNLRYDLFFPEKRPFFQEGSEKLAVAATRTFDYDPMYVMVNTRTIVNPIAGAKFSGKINDKNDFTLLYAADQLSADGEKPMLFNHVPVARYKKSFNGDSYIGALYTGGEREDQFNRMYGADGQIRLNQSTQLEFNAFNSHTMEEGESRSGHAASLYLHSNTRNLNYGLIFKDLDEDFYANTAFIQRTGISQFGGRFMPRLYTGNSFFKRFDFELFAMAGHDKIYDMWEHFSFASFLAYLGGTSSLKMKYYNTTEIYLGERFKTGGLHTLFMTRLGDWFSGTILHRFNQAIYYSEDPYAGLMHRLSLSLSFQPFTKLNIDFSLTYSSFREAASLEMIYTYPIERINLSYQFNKYLFVRGILEYNGYYKSLLTDFLISFNYIPGTVFYVGYGSLYDSVNPIGERPLRPDQPYDMDRGVFLKLSYLFRK